MSTGVVYVPDDEDDIADEPPSAVFDANVIPDMRPGQVDLQVRICELLACILFALLVLISLTWRQYGRLILQSRSSTSKPPAVAESPETTAIRTALDVRVGKKHR